MFSQECCDLERQLERHANGAKLEKTKRVDIDYQKRTIPLVFHIVTKSCETDKVEREQIERAVQDLNADFSATNEDRLIEGNMFFEDQVSMDMDFQIADYDEVGNRITGVFYYERPVGYSLGDLQKEAFFDRSKYLNVWVVDAINGASGYAFYPELVDSPNSTYKDGIVIAKGYLGKTGLALDTNREHILAHEVGHWLGLAHAWGDDRSDGRLEYRTVGDRANCKFDDGIADTPNTIGANAIVLPIDAEGSDFESGCSGPGNIYNVMDYGAEIMFTPGQREKAYQTLSSDVAGRNKIGVENEMIFETELDNAIKAQLVSTSVFFVEGFQNDGRINTPLEIELIGCDSRFKARILPSDYVVRNLPKGLNMRIRRTAANRVELRCVGKAEMHEKQNNIKNISIEFFSSAFEGLVPTKKNIVGLGILFINEYEIKYQRYIGKQGSKMEFLTLQYKQGRWKGIFLEDLGWFGVVGGKENSFIFYTELNEEVFVLCEENSQKIKKLSSGKPDRGQFQKVGGGLSGKKVFFDRGEWKNKSGYIYVKIASCNGVDRFAWFHFGFDKNFTEISIYEAGYNSDYTKPIPIGYRGEWNDYEVERTDILYVKRIKIRNTEIKLKEGGVHRSDEEFSLRKGIRYDMVLEQKSRTKTTWFIWIDLNHNGFYGDPGELVYISSESGRKLKDRLLLDVERGRYDILITSNRGYKSHPQQTWREGGMVEAKVLIR